MWHRTSKLLLLVLAGLLSTNCLGKSEPKKDASPLDELVQTVEVIGPRCASVVAVARGEDRDRLREVLPGADLIRFRPRPFSRSDDLLVVWHQQ